MDRFSEKQEKIEQYRAKASALYPALWSKMIAEWIVPDPQDRVWLMYSANYLFRTRSIRWAIDPLILNWRLKDAPRVDAAHDLGRLTFIVLTHDHNDHLDIDLLSALRHLPIRWIVPEFLLSKVMGQAGLSREKIMIPSPLIPIEIYGIKIIPFEGLHWETAADGSLKGLPAMGYLIESNGKRWLFPGDTRTYDASRLPSLDPVDMLFAHLWLGRGSALLDEPPLLEPFCRFLLDLKPRRIILTHLYELGRDANDFWDESHMQMVNSRFQEMSANISISPLLMGGTTIL